MSRASETSGIHGILDQIVGTDQRRQISPLARNAAATQSPRDSFDDVASAAIPRTIVRRGRPLRGDRPETVIREKVTLRIAIALLTQYRDWTWEARLPLSTLVEQAMQAHLVGSRRSVLPSP